MEFIESPSQDFWWNVAETCDYATFFHSPLWHHLASTTFEDLEDRTVAAVTDDGTRLVLPLLKIGESARGMMEDLMSTYAGCYGGVIADGPVSTEEIEQLYGLARTWDVSSLRVKANPLWKEVNHSTPLPEDKAIDDFTQIIELDGRTFEDVASDFTDGHRSAMHKGERMGVEVRGAETLDDYRAYFGAYEDCLRRWDDPSSVYPWKLFENGFELGQQHPDHLKLWLAEVEGKVIAGAWFFYWNDHVDYWHAASYEEYFDHKPNNVLLPHVMNQAIEDGYKYFDFNPSGGIEGVVRFKKHFGARKWPVQRWEFQDGKLSFVRKARSYFQ